MGEAPVVLALDAGQTGTKVRWRSADGSAWDAVLPGVRTDVPLVPQLAASVRDMADRAGGRPSVVAAGVSGLTDASADASALLELVAPLGVERVVLAHDSVTSFLGTLGDTRGAVVASGDGAALLSGLGGGHALRALVGSAEG